MTLVHRALAIAIVGFLATVTPGAPVLFLPDYSTEGVGEGFNDSVLGPARKNAFQFALGLMGNFLEASYVGETYVVQATFDPLGGGPSSAILAGAGATNFYTPPNLSPPFNNFPVAGVYYPAALTGHLFGSDVQAFPEIQVVFNSDVDNATVLGTQNWYYGTNALPGIHVDLVTVTLHELGHGIGFDGFLQTSGAYDSDGTGAADGLTTIYDYFMNTSSTAGTKLVNLAPTTTADSTRAAETIGDDLWWDGAQGTAGGGGVRPQLHAPVAFAPGSSLYHLSETALAAELLSPIYSGPDHLLSARELGMLRDIGWNAIPEPGAWLFGMVGSLMAGVLVRRSVQSPR